MMYCPCAALPPPGCSRLCVRCCSKTRPPYPAAPCCRSCPQPSRCTTYSQGEAGGGRGRPRVVVATRVVVGDRASRSLHSCRVRLLLWGCAHSCGGVLTLVGACSLLWGWWLLLWGCAHSCGCVVTLVGCAHSCGDVVTLMEFVHSCEVPDCMLMIRV